MINLHHLRLNLDLSHFPLFFELEDSWVELVLACRPLIPLVASNFSSLLNFETVYLMVFNEGAELVDSQGDQTSDLAAFETSIELLQAHFIIVPLSVVGEGFGVDDPIHEVL